MKRRGRKRRSSQGGECRGSKTAFVTETNTTGRFRDPALHFVHAGQIIPKSPPSQQPEDQTLHRALINYTSAHLPPSRNRRAAGLRKKGRGFVSRLLNRDGRIPGIEYRKRERERGNRVKDRVESEDLIARGRKERKRSKIAHKEVLFERFPKSSFSRLVCKQSVTIRK